MERSPFLERGKKRRIEMRENGTQPGGEEINAGKKLAGEKGEPWIREDAERSGKGSTRPLLTCSFSR